MVVKQKDKPVELVGNGNKAELELINNRAIEGGWTESTYLQKRKEYAKSSGIVYEESIKLVSLLKF